MGEATRGHRGRLPSSLLLRGGGAGAILGGTLFGVWGYLHGNVSPSYFGATLAHAMGIFVPMLFLVGIVSLFTLCERSISRLGRAGFVVCVGAAMLGMTYGTVDTAGIMDADARYIYLAERNFKPELFSWLIWLIVGLMLAGIASISTETLKLWGLLLLLMGSVGWAYQLTSHSGVVGMRLAHILFGALFSLSWIVLGCLLLSKSTGK